MFESIAYAAEVAEAAPQVNPLVQFMPIILMFVIFYFLLIRPQQKKQKELQVMISNLKKGDKVVTTGGIIGTISSIQEKYIVLSVGDSDSKIEVLKGAIAGMYQ
ncbi:MAG TPA: preprotein translocase subunit YajC [Candidatus Omnitrophota bacterium]|nr:preprotein translocase subunit YajC [Candidatus Omnitrophota bacterium]HRY85056.1 preprotein translocase subunit YajC [Candidatus Omnitrophota bacterium]